MSIRIFAISLCIVLVGVVSARAESDLFAPNNMAELHYTGISASGNREFRTGVSARAEVPVSRGTLATARVFTESIDLKMSDAGLDDSFADLGAGMTVKNRNVYMDFGVSSTSDKPFDTGDEIMYEATVGYNVQHTMYSDFYVGLSYSTRRIWLEDTVIPWIQFHVVEEDLELFAGIPFGIRYRPTEDSFIEAVYMPVKNLDVTLGYDLSRTLTVQLEGGMTQDKYLIAERTPEKDRMFVERTYAGIRGRLSSRNGMMDVSVFAGYTMNGKMFIGEDYNDNANATDLGSAPMYELKGRLFF